jgi:soluble lytic murein transglycosylase-like protein
MVTLAVPLVAALLISPATQVAPPAIGVTGDTDPPVLRAAGASPAPAARGAAHANFDHVAAILAKRYRVSTRATLDVVRAAYDEASRNGVDPLLVLAVMAIESSFNPIAESDGGAVGLMQIVPRFHEDKIATRGDSILDPHVNIEIGVQVLRDYIRRAGTETAGLQLYNGSPDDPANAYANKVMGERDRLRRAIGNGNRA